MIVDDDAFPTDWTVRFYPSDGAMVKHRIEHDIAEPAREIRTGVRVRDETPDSPGYRVWVVEVRQGGSGEWETLVESRRRLDTREIAAAVAAAWDTPGLPEDAPVIHDRPLTP
ncbi:hypothetical protein RYH80_18795 [Halobaculum sp. MBLA0147]|uniref:hypothetical protein n=1 Tax=Halobaculum sp. MBLA0147 TaxID=3079934 RepID=UPI003525A220